MARKDIPQGFIPTGTGTRAIMNPATGLPFPPRGAYNPVTGQYIPRRALESPRLAQEAGLASGGDVYKQLAQLNKGKPRLPARLPVYYSRVERGKRVKVLLKGQHKRHFRTFQEMIQAIGTYPPNAIFYVRVYGRNPYATGNNSPRFKAQLANKVYRYADQLRWITATAAKFRADEVQQEIPGMIERLENMYDIRQFALIYTGLG